MPTTTGTNNDDTIDLGGSNPFDLNTIVGLDGDDSIVGGTGDDVIYGGDGADTITSNFSLISPILGGDTVYGAYNRKLKRGNVTNQWVVVFFYRNAQIRKLGIGTDSSVT